jgi:hypothetical protein
VRWSPNSTALVVVLYKDSPKRTPSCLKPGDLQNRPASGLASSTAKDLPPYISPCLTPSEYRLVINNLLIRLLCHSNIYVLGYYILPTNSTLIQRYLFHPQATTFLIFYHFCPCPRLIRHLGRVFARDGRDRHASVFRYGYRSQEAPDQKLLVYIISGSRSCYANNAELILAYTN